MAVTRTVGVVVPAFRPDVEQLCAYVRAVDERLAPDAIRIELDDPEPGVAERLATLPATVNAVDRRRGKGAAVTAGFEALDTDLLAFADADGATPAESLAAVVAPVRSDEADLAVGSRRHPEATVRSHQTVARRFLGDGFAWIARRLLDARLHDFQCGAKALTRETWQALRPDLREAGFGWDIELIASAGAMDRRLVEVPVVWEDQPGSTVSPVRAVLGLSLSLLQARALAKTQDGSRLYAPLAPDSPPLVDRLATDGEAPANAAKPADGPGEPDLAGDGGER